MAAPSPDPVAARRHSGHSPRRPPASEFSPPVSPPPPAPAPTPVAAPVLAAEPTPAAEAVSPTRHAAAMPTAPLMPTAAMPAPSAEPAPSAAAATHPLHHSRPPPPPSSPPRPAGLTIAPTALPTALLTPDPETARSPLSGLLASLASSPASAQVMALVHASTARAWAAAKPALVQLGMPAATPPPTLRLAHVVSAAAAVVVVVIAVTVHVVGTYARMPHVAAAAGGAGTGAVGTVSGATDAPPPTATDPAHHPPHPTLDPTFLAAVNLASQEFIKGFIAGQLILGALFFGLIKFFLLRSGAETRRAVHKAQRMRNAVLAQALGAVPMPPPPGAATLEGHAHEDDDDLSLPGRADAAAVSRRPVDPHAPRSSVDAIDFVGFIAGDGDGAGLAAGPAGGEDADRPAAASGSAAAGAASTAASEAAAAPPDPTAPWGALTFDAAGHVVPKPGHASRGGPPLESCEWLNVLLAAVVRRYREDRAFMANLVRTLDTALNGPRVDAAADADTGAADTATAAAAAQAASGAAPTSAAAPAAEAAAAASSPSTAVGRRPSYLGPILITHFHLGNAFPRFGAARVRYAEPNGALRVEMGFSYHDQIALGIDTQILLNWPHAMTASLPVSLGVRVVHLSGVIAVQMVTPPADAEDGEAPYLAVSVLDNDHLHVDFAFRSLLGHRTKVKDLAKLGEMLASKLRSIFREAIVEPRFHRIPLPPLFAPAIAPAAAAVAVASAAVTSASASAAAVQAVANAAGFDRHYDVADAASSPPSAPVPASAPAPAM